MYKFYFKFAWRNILKNKRTTTMNIASLSIGIASFIFITIYLTDQLSYDQFHSDYERIYRVPIDFMDSEGNRLPDATSPPALAPALKSDFPEVTSAVRLFPGWGRKFLLGTSDENQFFEKDVIRTDSNFFEIFDFSMIYGDSQTALNDGNSIVITKDIAYKYFGELDVLGKEIILFGEENKSYLVSGVLENVPQNSHFKFDFLIKIPFENLEENWGWYNYYTYIKLSKGIDLANFEAKLQPFFESHLDEAEFYNIIYLQALKDIHLKSHLKWELDTNGDIANIYIFSALALFVLVLSCLNYINLTIAESVKRFKEVGVRKAFGAVKKSLVSQFLIETILVVTISMLLAVIFSQFLFMNLTDLIGYEINIFDANNLIIMSWISVVVLAVGVISGIYPAFYLSSYKIAAAVKGAAGNRKKSFLGLREVLLIIQFSISALMIFGTIVVYNQLGFIQSKNKGFDPEQVLVIENVNNLRDYKVLKNEIEQLSSVNSAGVSSGVIGGLNWTTTVGYPDGFLMNYIAIEPSFLETLGVEFVSGRNFIDGNENDASGFNLIINQTALSQLGITNEDVGKDIPITSNNDSIVYGRVVGVVKDFHFTDFKSAIKPFAFLYREGSMPYLNVKISSENITSTLESVSAIWSKYSNSPLEYSFLDQTFNDLHNEETKLSKILLYLTALAMFIAVMGMFSIVDLTLKAQLKEIAIRKVLGASIANVTQLVTKKFIVLVTIANLIACPIAYLLLNNWLNNFEFHIVIGSSLFIIVVGVTSLVALLTVGTQSFKTAMTNPTTVLRSE
ncbi:ABC transporter permease [Fulvivirga lutimaris]|uniref:ABC transporter permease n=1 Tax=Fulvivirga lutimaris TaxID=1819566 RepID=UPI0012BC165D|nr:ABC transporter permease [Fulvivirga lutimaris]MTI39170.1 FtsX-like permease family protein [Fulvivirga lutimaris]